MDKEKQKRGVFSTEEVADLLAKFEQSSLSEMRLRNGEVEIEFRRGVPASAAGAYAPAAHLAAGHAPHQPGAAQPAAAASARDKAPAVPSGAELISSPIVGTFYRSPAPDAPPFVETGSKVKKGQTICILEAMKLMNELEAEFDCEIVTILVENGKMVEFGAPLFEVRRT